jgi:hypothetical protein
MPPYQACPATPPTRTSIHLALASFADDVVGTLARLFLYVGTLALLAILALAALGQLPSLHDDEPALKPGWSVADRSHPAFAVSRLDSNNKTASYIILRHPEGGRKDVMRWVGDAALPVAELEIYRAGGEFDPAARQPADMAARMGLKAATPLEAAGLIDSKFGPVTLFRPSGETAPASPCLSYLKRIEEPGLQISGWSCQGDTLPARRAAIACMLNRLTLLTSGNEPRLAELFAHAELKRRPCGPAGSTGWLTGMENAQLRGSL